MQTLLRVDPNVMATVKGLSIIHNPIQMIVLCFKLHQNLHSLLQYAIVLSTLFSKAVSEKVNIIVPYMNLT